MTRKKGKINGGSRQVDGMHFHRFFSEIDLIGIVIHTLIGFVRLALGEQHSMILKQYGSVWTAGFNKNGQLGDGSTVTHAKFMSVFPSGAKAVAAASDCSMILKKMAASGPQVRTSMASWAMDQRLAGALL